MDYGLWIMDYGLTSIQPTSSTFNQTARFGLKYLIDRYGLLD
jgi:hypothetical protein